MTTNKQGNKELYDVNQYKRPPTKLSKALQAVGLVIFYLGVYLIAFATLTGTAFSLANKLMGR